MEVEVINRWMMLAALFFLALAGCDDGNDNGEPPADSTDVHLVFDTLSPQDTQPGLDLPKGWTKKKDLHKEE